MKKILFGTTALLAAGAFASAAQASDPIKLQLGGYMEYWVAAANQDSAFSTPVNSFDIQGESEVWFVGKTTLDNGMVIELGRQRPDAPISDRLQRFVDFYPSVANVGKAPPSVVDMRYPNGFALRLAAALVSESRGTP